MHFSITGAEVTLILETSNTVPTTVSDNIIGACRMRNNYGAVNKLCFSL